MEDKEPNFRSFIFESADDRTDDELPTPAIDSTDAILPDADRRRLRVPGKLVKPPLCRHSENIAPYCSQATKPD